jgi:hypothetical protein
MKFVSVHKGPPCTPIRHRGYPCGRIHTDGNPLCTEPFKPQLCLDDEQIPSIRLLLGLQLFVQFLCKHKRRRQYFTPFLA